MAKLAQNFAKYLVRARMHANGIVERPDIIGAIFGQTEGLLGADLDLREMQRTGRIGRIEVHVKNNKGRSYADLLIPSSLDASETALIAASLETIDKVGPCDAEIEISKVEDVRTQKRKYVIERAKDILRLMLNVNMPDVQRMSEMIKESVRAYEVASYYGLACGPDIQNSEEIIIVEGRADVINLLKNGIKNVIAIEGSKIPETVVKLTREKTTTAFLDGDRGGDLDLKKLLSTADIDFIARADEGMEVEELTKKQIFKALREKIAAAQFIETNGIVKQYEKSKPENNIEENTSSFLMSLLDEILGTRAVYFVNEQLQTMAKIPLTEIVDMTNEFPKIYAIVLDGKLSQSLINMASQRNIRCVVATGFMEKVRIPTGLSVLTQKSNHKNYG